MRGIGLEVKNKYEWCKQPNGLYTIFDVEIFEPTVIAQREFTADWIDKAVLLFEQGAKKGVYPRVHLGHHDPGGVENRQGAGFIGHMQRSGKTLYADLVDVPEVVFLALQKHESYPHRSAEILPPFEKISSLALMESRAQYFEFPSLILEDSPSPLKFQERGIFLQMPFDEKEKKEKPEPGPAAAAITAQTPPTPAPQAPPAPAQGPPDWAQKLTTQMDTCTQMCTQCFQMCSKIVDALQLDEQDEQQEQEPQGPPNQGQQAPKPVNMQSQDDLQLQFQAMTEKVEQLRVITLLRDRLSTLRDKGIVSSEVEAQALEFAKHGEKPMMLFLDTVERMNFQSGVSTHPATKEAARRVVDSMKVDTQYQDVAIMAFQNYQETMLTGSDREKSALKKVADTPERFVDRVITLEKAVPGAGQKMLKA